MKKARPMKLYCVECGNLIDPDKEFWRSFACGHCVCKCLPSRKYLEGPCTSCNKD
jgi:hypothetical protein